MNVKKYITAKNLKILIPSILAGAGVGFGVDRYSRSKKSKSLSLKNQVEKQKIARYFYALGQKNMYGKMSGLLRRR